MSFPFVFSLANCEVDLLHRLLPLRRNGADDGCGSVLLFGLLEETLCPAAAE